MKSFWLRLALANFLAAALIGLLLRFAFVAELPGVHYSYLLNAHTHTAMLGWAYIAIAALLAYFFVPDTGANRRTLAWLLGASQCAVIGMLLTFPRMGYALWSIVFSSMHVLTAYGFAWFFFVKRSRNQAGSAFATSAVVLMLISTLALWGLGAIASMGLRGSAWYYGAIQFFLHFQLNGWYLFAIIAFFFHWLGIQGVRPNPSSVGRFHLTLLAGTVLTYALAVAWSNPLPIIFLANGLGVIIQLLALIMLVWLLRRVWPEFRSKASGWAALLLKIAFGSFVLKILMQSSLVIPAMAQIAYTIRNFVIGFMHLHLLGVITLAIFGFAILAGKLNVDRLVARIGLVIFLAGFLLTELILFSQGLLFWMGLGFIPSYYELLFGASVFLPLGIGLLLFAQCFPREKFRVP